MRTLLCSLALTALLTGGAKAEEGPFRNSSLHGTYSYAAIFNNPGEPYPNGAMLGMFYFDGAGSFVEANLITNLPGEPDAGGNPTRFLMRSLSDTEVPWRHITGRYSVNPDGSILFDILNGQGTADAVPTRIEMIAGTLTISEFIVVDTGPSRFGAGLFVMNLSRIAEGNILISE